MKERFAGMQHKIGRAMFATVIAGALALMFGPSVYAEFARQTGNVTGVGYGYGYGYGAGNGWDGGTFAGLRLAGGSDDTYLYDYGFGYGIGSGLSATSWNASTGQYELQLSDMPNLVVAGLLRPNGPNPASTNMVTFPQKIQVTDAGNNFYAIIPAGTTFTAGSTTSFAALSATADPAVTGLPSGRTNVGSAQLGLPSLGLTTNPAITLKVKVGASYDTQSLTVYHKSPGSSTWTSLTTCVIGLHDSGFCQFNTTSLSSFSVATVSSGNSNPPASTSISLYAPTGGESFAGGSTTDVTWSIGGAGIYRTRVSFSADSGSNWSVLSSDVSGTSYSWHVPSAATTHGRIMVEGLNSSGSVLATSASGDNFTITMPSSNGNGGGSGGNGGAGSPPTGGNNGTPGNRGGSSSNGAMNRNDANQHLPPTVPVDSLVKIAGNSAVYYIGLDAKRHSFPTSTIYFSWYQDFSQVSTIDATTLASIPLGAPILVRPGTHWVKITSDPKTYYVEPGYTLRWIKDEAAARLLGGANWNHNIIDVDVSLFSVFTFGPDIDSTYLASDWPSGELVKATGSPEVFYTTPTGRRSFQSEAAKQANNFQQRFVVTTDLSAGWTHKTVEAMITGLEDALFSLMH